MSFATVVNLAEWKRGNRVPVSYVRPLDFVTPRRADLGVKWRMFMHLAYGADEDAMRIYLWHLDERVGPRLRSGKTTDRWKSELNDYVEAAKHLCGSMLLRGFSDDFPVPVDPDGELLDGSHRVACAVALRVPQIAVMRMWKRVWAPPWDLSWFEARNMPPDDFARLKNDLIAMRQ